MASLTIKDIAKKCGVGVSTVSRALNNHPDINPETRAKIMKVIEETGFIPNDSARYLKRTETNSIALLVKGISNPFFTKLIRTMESEIQAKGYETVLRHVDNMDDEVAVALSLVKERKLKGIVFLGGAFTHDEHELRSLGVPFIFATAGNPARMESMTETGGENPSGSLTYANIAVDDVDEAKKAVNYLISQGHRNIGIIAEGLNIPSIGQLRMNGYEQALLESGLRLRRSLIYEVKEGVDPYSMPNGYEAAKALLERNPDMTAIFCISDVLAFGACRAIEDAGKKIPEDISIIGFDGLEEGEYYNPRLTTICQPVDEMAHRTIEFLFNMIAGTQKPENITMPGKLLVRESTGNRK